MTYKVTPEDAASLEDAILRITTKTPNGLSSHYNPFYGAILQNMRITFDYTVPTAGIYFDQRYQRYCIDINPDTWKQWAPNEQTAVLLHEVLHLRHGHLTRLNSLREQDLKRSNLAADAAINQLIEGLPDGSIYPKIFGLPDGKTTEYYFNNWPNKSQTPSAPQQNPSQGQQSQQKAQQNKDPQSCSSKEQSQQTDQPNPQQEQNSQECGGEQSQSGSGQDQQSDGQSGSEQGQNEDNNPGSGKSGKEYLTGSGETLDSHEWDKADGRGGTAEEMAEAEKALVEAAIRTMKSGQQAEALTDAQAWMKDIQTPTSKVDWKKQLKQFLSKHVIGIDRIPTRTKPNKRYGYAAPGLKREELPTLWVLIDTSGSISEEAINQSITEVAEILKVGFHSVTVGLWHTSLYDKFPFKKSTLSTIKERIKTGNTSFESCAKEIAKHKPDAVIVLTDGEFYNTDTTVTVPILYILTADGRNKPTTSYPHQQHIKLPS